MSGFNVCHAVDWSDAGTRTELLRYPLIVFAQDGEADGRTHDRGETGATDDGRASEGAGRGASTRERRERAAKGWRASPTCMYTLVYNVHDYT
jgi:hypothetical protein